MSNSIILDGGITLVLSDDVMNKLFGGLLYSQVNNLQKQVDCLTRTVSTLDGTIAAIDDSIELLQENVSNLEFKFDDTIPENLEMRIDELESHSEMECELESVKNRVDRLDRDIDIINGIFGNVANAILSKVTV